MPCCDSIATAHWTRFDLANTLDGNPTYVEGGAAVVLDSDVQIFDAELSAANDFNGATLTLSRNGGANVQDVFNATGTLSSISAASGNLVVGGTTIGTYTNSGGTLVFTFNASATNTLVNSAMQQITYANSSDTPPDSVQIDWTFNDGNTADAQGTGGALAGTGSTTVNITEVYASGTSDDDIIVGTTGSDSLDGGTGNDIVLGGADLLGNGNFNSTSVDSQFNVTGTNSGWTISGGSVDFLGRDLQSLLRPNDANDANLRAVDLHNATIAQTLSGLTIGETYSVAFMLGGQAAGDHVVNVSTDGTVAGTQSITATMPGGNTLGTMDWQARVYTFTATATSHTLSISSISGDASDGPLLAGVRMVAHSGVSGNDTLRGGSGNDVVIGAAGNDNIHGGFGVDTIYGGAGGDTIGLSEAEDGVADTVDGGDGSDSYYIYTSNTPDIYVDSGTDGAVDTIVGYTAGHATYYLRDTFSKATTGIDRIHDAYSTSYTTYLGNSSHATALNWDLTGIDLQYIEYIYGGTQGDTIIVDDTGAETTISIYGFGGDDTLIGNTADAQGTGGALAGTGSTTVNITEVYASGTSDDDIIVGTTGSDSLDGGTGNDIVLGGADLLGNGNFNSTSVDSQFNVTGTNSGWTISGGSVDFLGRDLQSLLRPNDANDANLRAVDLHNATIAQTLSGLTIGETYSVAFMLGGQAAGDHVVNVSTDGTVAGTQSITATMPGGNTLGTMDWQARVYTFTATATSHTLSISSISGDASDGPLLAGVRMVAHSGVSGNDTLRGGSGNDVVIGAAGNDNIHGGFGADTIYGGAGGDTIGFSEAEDGVADTVDGGDGSDSYYIYANNTPDIYVDSGTDGAVDTIVGYTAGHATYYLRDTFSKATTGIDRIHDAYSTSYTTYLGNSSHATALNWDLTGIDLQYIEYIFGGTQGDTIIVDDNGTGETSYIYGYAGDDDLRDGAGAHYLYGGNDNDTLYGGASNDYLYGDAGIDTAVYDGNFLDYSINRASYTGNNNSGYLRVTETTVNGVNEGSDYVYGTVEFLRFADGDYDVVNDQFFGNSAPVLDNTGTMSFSAITEDDTNNAGQSVASIIVSAGGDRITDGDGDPEGIAINATVDGNGHWEYSIDGGANWDAVGVVSENAALLLRETDLIRFVPNAANGTTGSITFRAWDQVTGTFGTKVDTSTNGGVTSYSAAIESATITVNSVNDAPTFDVGTGVITHDLTTSTDTAYAVAMQDDGKMIVAGEVWNGGDSYDFGVTRLNADGTLDTSFGTGGHVILAFDSDNDQARDVWIQSDGKILVGGYSFMWDGNFTNDFTLVRLNTDGTLDTSFDGDGKLTTDIGGGYEQAYSLVVQDDGKILMAGSSRDGDHDFALVRYNSDGSLDTGFGGGDGKVTTPIGAGDDIAYAMALQDDGDIVLTGTNGSNLVVVRYDSVGVLDATFGTGGIVTTDIGSGADQGNSVVIQGDGSIVVAGFTDNGGSLDFFVARYDTNGALDGTFGTGGIVTTAIGSGADRINDMVLQADGKIVVTGSTHNGSNQDVVVARYDANGVLDSGFGTGGIVATDLAGAHDLGYGVTLQADGKIVVVGDTLEGDSNYMVLRYNSDGTLDTEFAPVTTLDGNPTFVEDGAAVVLDSDVDVSDAELDALNGGLGNYSGSSLTLVRNGGANAEDLLSFIDGNGITLSGGNLIKNSQTIASFDTTSTAGQLVITFTDAGGEIPTSADVDNILRQVTYSNSSNTPPASVQIDWTFNDGNTADAQGTGGALTATGSTTVNITAVNDAPAFTTLPNSVSTNFLAGGNDLLSIGSGDFDGDGDIDLVADNLVGDIRIATNDGSGIFADAGLILDTAGEIESLKVVDIDGDSDLDIIAVTYDVFNTNPAVHVLTNDGTGSFTVVSMETAFLGADDIAFGDLDNDGDIDIAATFWSGGNVAWYENMGAGSWTKQFIDQAFGAISVEIADMNGDGFNDLVVGARNINEVVLFTNDGVADPTFARSTAGMVSQAFFVSTADLDGDGDLDIAYQGLNGITGWLENDGTASPTFTDHFLADYGTTRHINTNDYDNDGDQDLFVAHSGGSELLLWTNDGTGMFTESVVDTTATNIRRIEFGDIDGDGDDDFLTVRQEVPMCISTRTVAAARSDCRQMSSRPSRFPPSPLPMLMQAQMIFR
ncbi:MAG: FG-GAP-like repeat-containing protein [Pirellulaceae bacterium]